MSTNPDFQIVSANKMVPIRGSQSEWPNACEFTCQTKVAGVFIQTKYTFYDNDIYPDTYSVLLNNTRDFCERASPISLKSFIMLEELQELFHDTNILPDYSEVNSDNLFAIIVVIGKFLLNALCNDSDESQSIVTLSKVVNDNLLEMLNGQQNCEAE